LKKEGGKIMRKKPLLVAMITMTCFLLSTWAPCLALELQGCYHKKKGNLRLLTDPSKGCKKSELPVTLSGMLGGAADVNPVPSFEGRVCWNSTVTATDPATGYVGLTVPLEGEVTYIGGGMYRIEVALLYNTFMEGQLPLVMHGVALYIGGKVVIHLTASEDYTPSSLREVGTFQATLDTESSGTFWAITKLYNPSGTMQDQTMPAGFTDLYYEGTLTPATCSQ
jgi:hypothetical protein